MKGYTSYTDKGYIVDRDSGNAIMLKNKWRSVDTYGNVMSFNTTTMWIPKKCCKVEDNVVYIADWFIKKVKPKTFKNSTRMANCSHEYGAITTGYSDSWEKRCKLCGHHVWDE